QLRRQRQMCIRDRCTIFQNKFPPKNLDIIQKLLKGTYSTKKWVLIKRSSTVYSIFSWVTNIFLMAGFMN
ncbi:hypothetical protein KQJ29_21070, partial [Enterococcus sp. S181_ASV_20]|nr:hypothetical protein [Enterococcus sp. S181_ASV_20]